MTDFISSKLSISTEWICRENKDGGEIGYTVLRGFERGEWVADLKNTQHNPRSILMSYKIKSLSKQFKDAKHDGERRG